MTKAAIFDMDGLMIDSDRIISRAYEEVLKEHGKKPRFSNRGIVHTPGISAVDNWNNLVKVYDINADINELVKKKSHLHIQYMKEGVNAMPGLLRLLELLKEHGIKMAIATSSTCELVESVLKQLDIKQYFDVIVPGGEVENGKPAPDIFLKAAAELGVSSRDSVVFEDATDGVRAAKAAQMICIAIPSADSLDDNSFKIADIVLPSLEKVSWSLIERLK